MAKLYARSRPRQSKTKVIHAKITVDLVNRPGGARVLACAMVGATLRKRMQPAAISRNTRRGSGIACAEAKNVRQAVRLALRAVGDNLGSRSGAFAGWRK